MRVVGAALIAAVLLMEVAARLAGLGSTLVYEKTDYGYRVVPNQSLTRLGRAIHYNALGLRNEATAAVPAANTLRILCVGDSITFGGTLTDQQQTFPSQLQALLANSRPGVTVEVLNASAGGWAIENEEGWLNAHGVLGAQWVVLQVATHDLFQEKSASDIVGTHPSFPERQPLFALHEFVARYAMPRVGRLAHDPGVELHHRSADDVRRVLASIERIDRLARGSRARLAVLFVEQPHGVEPRDRFTQWAKVQLFNHLSQWDIPVIRPAPAIERAGGARLFRDEMHPAVDGNRVLARSLWEFFQSIESQADSRSTTKDAVSARRLSSTP